MMEANHKKRYYELIKELGRLNFRICNRCPAFKECCYICDDLNNLRVIEKKIKQIEDYEKVYKALIMQCSITWENAKQNKCPWCKRCCTGCFQIKMLIKNEYAKQGLILN